MTVTHAAWQVLHTLKKNRLLGCTLAIAWSVTLAHQVLKRDSSVSMCLYTWQVYRALALRILQRALGYAVGQSHPIRYSSGIFQCIRIWVSQQKAREQENVNIVISVVLLKRFQLLHTLKKRYPSNSIVSNSTASGLEERLIREHALVHDVGSDPVASIFNYHCESPGEETSCFVWFAHGLYLHTVVIVCKHRCAKVS